MHQIPNQWTNASGQVWLNVGSGPYPEREFVNLDNHLFMHALPFYSVLHPLLPAARRRILDQFHDASQKAIFVRHDCRKPLDLPAQSVDHILCSHFLEHVFGDEARRVVRGFAKVLKPGATLHVIVPDLEQLARAYLDGPRTPGAADTFLAETLLSLPRSPSWRYRALELLGFEGMQHRWMYDQWSMTALIEECGFELLSEAPSPSAHVRKNDGSLHAYGRKRH